MADLQTIGGVGPKTADQLTTIGIDDTQTFCNAYFCRPGQTVADALAVHRRVHRHFFRNPIDPFPDDTSPDVPVDGETVCAVMAFVREYGSQYTHSASASWQTDLGPDDVDSAGVTPADIEWTADAFVAEPQGYFGVLHSPTPVENDEDIDFTAIDTQPTAVTVAPDDHENCVRYTADGQSHCVDKRLLDELAAFTQSDYTTPDNLDAVRVNPDTDAPVQFGVETDMPLVLAPRLRDA